MDIKFSENLNYTITNVGFLRIVRPANHHFEYKTGKERYSFIYIEDGEMEYTFTNDKSSIVLNKDSLLYIPEYYPYYATYLKDDTTVRMFTFQIEGTLPEFLNNPFTLQSPDISSAFNSVNNQNTLLIYSNIYKLLYILEDESTYIPVKFRKIVPAVNQIKQKYFENHKMSYYAELCNMSESNFRKLFREYTSMSPIEYRNKIRIVQVKRLIDTEGYSVSEAAYITGFNNISFFYEIYNRYK